MAQLLYIAASFYIILCPFTKVEESFNMQAFHDILYHRHNLSMYDHNEYSGVVPRTFVGPLYIALVSAPVVSVLQLLKISKYFMQYVVRCALAFTVGAWSRLRNSLEKRFGTVYALWFTIITVTQYHFMFYLSRPLPNIMAMPLVLLAFDGWMNAWHKQFLICAGASIIIFRSELMMLFGLFLIIDLHFKKIDPILLIKIVVPAGIGLVLLTVLVDSLFWGRLLWPEFEVFWYNTILNKSSDWGTSPFLWYWYSALPRGLGPSMLLIPFGLYLDRRLITYVAPAIVYLLLYSFLPHKELRFIMYVFPLFNMASAATCAYLHKRKTKGPMYELLFWGMVIIVLGNVVLSAAFASVAVSNYPGGVAMLKFHKLLKNEPYVHLHIGNLAAQTGVTRFTELNDNWKYSKNESLQLHQLQYYTHLLIEAKSKYSPNLKTFTQTHTILDSVEAFSHIAMNSKLIPPVRIKTKPAIFILERKDFREYPEGRVTEAIEEDYETTSSEKPMVKVSVNIDDFNLDEEMFVAQFEYDNAVLENFKKEIKTQTDNVEDEKATETFSVSDTDANLQSDTEVFEEEIKEHLLIETVIAPNDENTKIKSKKIFDDIKLLRQERKQKAIEKIKLETRKEVVASAKEKLKDIMKRHKHIAEELTQIAEQVPITVTIDNEIEKENQSFVVITNETEGENIKVDTNDTKIHSNENVNDIVEEVILRLIDRKIYDDKTKPEDIKAEDRQIIQQIVEEVVAERMNYTRTNST